ncbi:MAG: ABC transporter ATP-binding protein [Alphaproteobacteria bacterium]|nr:ABC transporter ATP-binding protein [Alphaproteobacteria bacterium]
MSDRLEIQGVTVAYDGVPAVREVSLTLPAGSISCLLGPSGCGKTSLLRAIAGFEPVAAGKIRLAGRTVSTPDETVPPELRNVGMVFQDFALFPHLPVRENIGFGLRAWGAAARAERIEELLDLIGLAPAAAAYPHQLSGGQQQRVALARAMAPRPGILLMDEPFSSIDAELREQLAGEVRAMLLRDDMTAILVTHDQNEAFAMTDRVAVFGEGRLQQWDSAYRIYHEPANRFVADFIGQGALLPGEILGPDRVGTELGVVVGAVPAGCAAGSRVLVLVRPDDVIHDDNAPTHLEVVKRTFRGANYLYTLQLPSGRQIFSLVSSHHDHAVGSRIGVRLGLEHLAVFPVPAEGAQGPT